MKRLAMIRECLGKKRDFTALVVTMLAATVSISFGCASQMPSEPLDTVTAGTHSKHAQALVSTDVQRSGPTTTCALLSANHCKQTADPKREPNKRVQPCAMYSILLFKLD